MLIHLSPNKWDAFLERGLDFGIIDSGPCGAWVAVAYNDFHNLKPTARGEDSCDE